MSVLKQNLLAVAVLAIGAAVHITVLVAAIGGLQSLDAMVSSAGSLVGSAVTMGIGFAAVLAGHSVPICIWAAAFRLTHAIYFALVTTTTLDYGDITLSRPHRLFGAVAAVSGLLTCGLSTAFLIGVVQGALSNGRSVKRR
ncbi:MAG: ion channel [Pseudomonadota bacterium]